MNSQTTKNNRIEVSVIGSGIAGLTTSFYLAKKGYKVNLIDPKVNTEINNLNPNNGTQAALGVLMGNIYKRSKGRAFLLRNKSMKLWKEWLSEIDQFNSISHFFHKFILLLRSKKALPFDLLYI